VTVTEQTRATIQSNKLFATTGHWGRLFKVSLLSRDLMDVAAFAIAMTAE
jgi:hypothetical protein